MEEERQSLMKAAAGKKDEKEQSPIRFLKSSSHVIFLLYENRPGYTPGYFLFHRKLLSYEIKTLREDRTAAEWKMSLVRPAAGGESCKAGFFLVRKNENRCY